MDNLNERLKNRITFSPEIAKITDSITTAVFFQQIWFWWDKRNSESIYKTIKEIEDATSLSRYKQDYAIKNLVKHGFIKYFRKGIPAKRHFIVNEEKVLKAIKNFDDFFCKNDNNLNNQQCEKVSINMEESLNTSLQKPYSKDCEKLTVKFAENSQVYTDHTTDLKTNSNTDLTTDYIFKNSENEFSQQKKINDFSNFLEENTKTDFQNSNSSKSNEIPPNSAASPLLEVENLYQKLKTSFKNFYLSSTNVDYNWTDKDWGTLKLLVQKLKFIAKSSSTDNEIINSFNHLLSEVKNNEWILKNLSLSIINMKFNEIVSSIKFNQNGNNSAKRKRGISDELRSELLVGIWGNKGYKQFATS